MKINNILCEYLINPIGLGIKNPRITWNLSDCLEQKGYEIEYVVNGIKYNKSMLTDNMDYTFSETFKSRDYVEYRIRVCDEKNNWSDWSEINHFELGLLEENDWQACWITGNYNPTKKKRYPVDYFSKSFSIEKVNKARLYITACGIYEASINGVRVGDFILAPGSTDPRKRIQYQVYDVTKLLNEGNNELNILLADGWYRGSIGAKGFTYVFGKRTMLKVQLEIETDKGKTLILSDESFKWCNDGPLLFADLKDGEIVDARKTPSYSKCAKVVKYKANLRESNNNYVVENEIYKPIKMWTNKSGNTIIEFPYNIAGYISFSIEAKAGDKIDIQMGEMLDSSLELSLSNIQCIRKNKKTPLQEVHYICKDGINNYHSKFFMAGFKYLSIKSRVKINIDQFLQIALYTKLNEVSKFNSSNELINIFYQNTLRSLKSNSIDIPTDCPTRERMGWTGDSQVFFETATFLTDYQAFTRKHIVDVYDRQDKNGRLPQIAPYSAEDWFMGVMNGSVGWADVGILTPYRFYKKYGDKRLLIENFDNMERYIKFMIRRCGRRKGIYAIYSKNLHLSKENRKYQVNNGQSYGEWAEPNDVKSFVWTDFCFPHPEESMAYTAWMMDLMVEICDIVGKTKNKALYQEYCDGIKKAYQELVTKPLFTLDTNRQAKLVRPLYMNLLNTEQKKYAKDRLIKALDSYGWRLGTGFLSTPFILYVLQDINPEYAYKLLENEEMPGWLYMAKNNTGTIWEGWEGPNAQKGIASLNHYSKGAMVEWLFKGMCGINIAGKNNFLLKPIIGGKEEYASCEYLSIYGKISLSWRRENDKVIFDIIVPANTRASFSYKTINKELISGNYHFEI